LPSPTTVPLIGRSGELAALRALLDRSAKGRGEVALVQGEAGIGKSRLLSEALAETGSSTTSVFFGCADELDRTRPFSAVADALGCRRTSSDPVAAAIADDLFAATDPAALDQGRRFRIIEAVLELLESAATSGPVVLALEDLHWADPSTMLVVGTVARRLATFPVALVVTFRPSPRVPELEGILDTLTRQGATHLVLGALDDPSVGELARSALGMESGPALLSRLHSAGGNPLFVMEMLSALAQAKALSVVEGKVEADGAPFPPSLRATVLRRISFLGDDSLELLRLAAVLGTTFSVADLGAVTGHSAVRLLSLLSEPLRAQVIEEADSSLRFRHDVIRNAIYEDIPADLRRALHRDVAHALERASATTSKVASHLAAGAERGDQHAIAWLRRAAVEAAPAAPATAIEILTKALGLIVDDAVAVASVNAELAELLAYCGSAAEAEQIARRALAGPYASEVEGRLRSTLVQALFAQGRWVDVVTEVETVSGHPRVDEGLRARLLAESALARIWSGDLEGAERDATRAVQLGEASGDDVATSFGLGHLSVVADQRGRFHEGVELAERSLQVASRGDEAEVGRRHPHIALGMALFAADRLSDSKKVLREGQRLGERLGTVWDLALYHVMLALPLYYLGDWDDAVAEAEAGLAVGVEIGSGIGTVTALSVMGSIAVHRDDMADAHRVLAEATSIVDEVGPQWGELWRVLGIASLLEADADLQRAYETLAGAWDHFADSGLVECQLRTAVPLVRLAVAVSQRSHAREVSDLVARGAAVAKVPYGEGVALMCRGLVEDDPELLLRSAQAFGTSGRRPEQAAAWEVAGTVLAGSSRQEEATHALGAGLELFEGLQARRDVARVRATLRAMGVRLGSHASHRRPQTGWDALTATETQIVRLAAGGLTNPEIGARLFISRRTVQSHLSHVFAKLGIASRVELAAMVAERGA
jgi:DNA-binding CsgD family transcriptional regulator